MAFWCEDRLFVELQRGGEKVILPASHILRVWELGNFRAVRVYLDDGEGSDQIEFDNIINSLEDLKEQMRTPKPFEFRYVGEQGQPYSPIPSYPAMPIPSYPAMPMTPTVPWYGPHYVGPVVCSISDSAMTQTV